ncbi:hypothetical protein POM88_035541 [Heracleum sosnowskyi]|uniref:Sodium/calcium exchanger membrane region domain-containing protein n=1 Tax=Heracleum sosnowskyi TaxID=360622 RepID=A0AAD8HN87_9APIA|nr:hypothetical protein POM88_035541 [Heracleum sosnowskyi]
MRFDINLREMEEHFVLVGMLYSLYGSILSNLLLVLGSSLLCGGLANLYGEQKYDRKQANVNSLLLILGLICHVFPLMFKYAKPASDPVQGSILQLSRASNIVMIIEYVAYLFFQLKTHHQLFEAQEEDEGNKDSEEKHVIGISSGLLWLIGMTITIALLSEYIVSTIEIPLCVIVGWIMGIAIDLDFGLL